MSWPDDIELLHAMLDSAPVGVLIIDEMHRIRAINVQAKSLLGCDEGDLLADRVNAYDTEILARALTRGDDAHALRLELNTGGRTLELTASGPQGQGWSTLFIVDISEKIALGRQLRTERQPSRKLLYRLHSIVASMLGYTELITLMLDEEPLISGDRLSVIRLHHKEVREGLQSLARLLKVERQGGRRPGSNTIPLNPPHIVVIDDEPAITAFIAELMKGLRYRVSAFTDPQAALLHCQEHSERVDLVIVDHSLPSAPEGSCVARLLGLPGDFPIVICSESADDLPHSVRTHLCHKPIDISDLTRIVADLIPGPA